MCLCALCPLHFDIQTMETTKVYRYKDSCALPWPQLHQVYIYLNACVKFPPSSEIQTVSEDRNFINFCMCTSISII